MHLDVKGGSWLIDDTKVDGHIAELKRQLNACRSVCAWIQAWNTYACRFFTINMGQPAACFGIDHVNMILKTFIKIHRSLFESGNGKVTGHLQKLVEERFGVSNIPDGFFYFPHSFGGLELRNPFITAFALRDAVPEHSSQILLKAFELDEDAYDTAKSAFENGNYTPIFKPGGYESSDPDEPFFSLEEFSRFREETSSPLADAYTKLLSVAKPEEVDRTLPNASDEDREDWSRDASCKNVELSREIKAAVSVLRYDREYEVAFKQCCRTGDLQAIDTYWRWVFEFYGKEMVRLFGGLGIGEKGMLPLGLVEMLKSERTRWLG